MQIYIINTNFPIQTSTKNHFIQSIYTIQNSAIKKHNVFSQECAIMGDVLQNKPVFLLNLYFPEHNDGYITCTQSVTMDQVVSTSDG